MLYHAFTVLAVIMYPAFFMGQFKISVCAINCATVGLYALCCNNWYRNNSLPFLLLCRHSKKFARVYRLLSKAWPYASAFCTAKRDSRAALHYCVAVIPLPTAALAATRQYFLTNIVIDKYCNHQ